jgi:hypothetical protein
MNGSVDLNDTRASCVHIIASTVYKIGDLSLTQYLAGYTVRKLEEYANYRSIPLSDLLQGKTCSILNAKFGS